jgi:nucleotide-binding universal stress UspA family protein
MSYKTILVHVDQSRHAAKRIRIAADIAMAENGHLIGAAMTGMSRFIYDSGTLNPNDPDLANHLEFLHERANRSLAEFDLIAREMGVLSFERRLIDDDVGSGICLQARYCDLVVIGQSDLKDLSLGVMLDLPDYVLMNCERPVLIIPHAGRFDHVGKKVLVAWNASAESTRAVTGAIPFLKCASTVEVAIFNSAAQSDAHGAQPGADIALYLARHDIKVEVIQQTTDSNIGNALLSLAADASSDLIVMGGYGHTRFREILLGGATRTILESMTIPILMSH